MMKRSPNATRAATLLLALAFAACSDPGSGGTGVPGTDLGVESGGSAVSTAPGASSPTPPALPAPVVGPDACSVAFNAEARVFVGPVEARTGACLRVDGRRFDIGSARIQFASGMPASEADLLVGQRVTITPVAGDPSKAESIVIEDS